ncbi:MAG: DUF934 domain-containing protein [Gallionella sp.]
MYILIKNGRIESGGWRTLTLAQGDTPHSVRLPVGPVLVPLSVWRARRTELVYREYEHNWPIGVWLGDDESVASIEPDIHDFAVIAVRADQYADRKHISAVRQLLVRYGYGGELRAIVEMPRERLAIQKQVGLDGFAGRDFKNARRFDGPALSGWFDFNSDNPPKRLATAG